MQRRLERTRRYADRRLQNNSLLVNRRDNSDARPDTKTITYLELVRKKATYKHGVPGPELQAERTGGRGQSCEVWIHGVGVVVPDC